MVRADPVGRLDLGLAVRDPVDLADRAVPGLGRDLEDPVGLGGMGLAVRHPVDPAGIRHRAGPVGLVVPDPVGRAAPVGLAELGLAVRVDLGMDRADPVGLADLELAGLAGLAELRLAVRVGLGTGRVGLAELGLADPAGLGLAVRADPGDQAVRVDLGDQGMDPADRVGRHRRRTHRGAISSGVAPRWAAPGTCRTDSAPPTTVHRLHRHNIDGAGMMGLHPERRRPSGTDRRPRVAGVVLRLPAVGTARGTVRRAIWGTRSGISGRSITTGTTRSRCLTRCSVDGASGSSVSGFRCTETSQNSWLRTLLLRVRRPRGVCSDSAAA